ncbi:MAG: SDR family oxidoreductase [Alphaproteobacteria bacterium]|nr:MAG: SDR family oxidoreductase [Alphaproteobacteria bacterium]
MDLGISGKTAIVCASSRGLGRGCAQALAEAGCHVVINGRDADVLARTAREIADSSAAKITPVAADVATADGQKALLDAAGNVDILVNNNAGPPLRDFRQLDRQAMIDGAIGNMITPIEMIQAVADGMIEREFGRIVNITSLTVKMPVQGLDLSSGARAGLTAFLAGVSRQIAASNVTINNLLPGKMETDRLRANVKAGAEKAGISVDEMRTRQINAIPAKRFGNAAEFGQACAFLCSVHAGYITGQNLLVDGGLVPTAF